MAPQFNLLPVPDRSQLRVHREDGKSYLQGPEMLFFTFLTVGKGWGVIYVKSGIGDDHYDRRKVKDEERIYN